MEGPRFDQFAKALVTRTDRRRVLEGLGALAGLLGTALGVEMATAKGSQRRKHRVRAAQRSGRSPGRCGRPGQPCKWDKQCCTSCANGTCTCPGTQVFCGDTQTCAEQCCAAADCVFTEQLDCLNGKCCRKLNVSCENDDQCCRTDVCDLESSLCAVCADVGQFCTSGRNCCPGLTCDLLGDERCALPS
jgi:hypothetical protein